MGYRPSYVWRSIIWGKELLAKGIRRRIGLGNATLNFGDPWLPREATFKVITPTPLDRANVKVSDMILASRYWNKALLRDVLWEKDVNCIVSIPICKTRMEDQWM